VEPWASLLSWVAIQTPDLHSKNFCSTWKLHWLPQDLLQINTHISFLFSFLLFSLFQSISFISVHCCIVLLYMDMLCFIYPLY
jgi:hypothetical protein